jgi:CheY-like chemotaxis protein
MLKAAPVQERELPSERPIGQAERLTILVVEDDLDTRNAACAVLSVAGFKTLSVENGKAGLELLSMLDVQRCLILLDLWMPVMDGWSFYAQLARDRKLRSIPVIFLTAYDREVEIESPKWLQKPVGMDTLLHAVRSTFAD